MMDSRISALFLCSTIFFLAGVHAANFTIENNCQSTVWPAILTGGGAAQLSTDGFELPSKSSITIDVPAPWSGRIWARSFCSYNDSNKFVCQTADCGSGEVSCNGAGGNPPASLAEFTLATNNGIDFYDVSLVDGFNLPISIVPQTVPGSNCNSTSCLVDLNPNCPQELAMRDDSETIIGCKSACLALNQSQFCCTGEFGSPDTCPPTSYSSYFKGQCPEAYSYAYDDKTSTFTCAGGANYIITFCPEKTAERASSVVQKNVKCSGVSSLGANLGLRIFLFFASLCLIHFFKLFA